MALDRIATILSWARRLAKRSDAVLERAEELVRELRTPEPVVVFEAPLPCIRCNDPLGYGMCDSCADEMLSRRASA